MSFFLKMKFSNMYRTLVIMATSDDQNPRIEAKVHDEEVKIVSIDEVTTGMMTFDSTN